MEIKVINCIDLQNYMINYFERTGDFRTDLTGDDSIHVIQFNSVSLTSHKNKNIIIYVLYKSFAFSSPEIIENH